jgi:uroporphyrinogen-III synthase
MVKKILVSQPRPNGKNPYADLEKKFGVQIDFRKFFDIEPIPAKEFRKQKINITDFSGIIFPSRTAIDHFFRLVEELKISVPTTMKYFCMNEQVALYLQKYTVYRKRRIFPANGTVEGMLEILEKHKSESLLIPLSEGHKSSLYNKLKKNKFDITIAEMYRTVSADLSDINIKDYDMLVFFSPWGVKALIDNFPDFEQNNTLIASFGNETAKALKKAGFRVDIKAPNKKAPSMPMAIENYLQEQTIAEKA